MSTEISMDELPVFEITASEEVPAPAVEVPPFEIGHYAEEFPIFDDGAMFDDTVYEMPDAKPDGRVTITTVDAGHEVDIDTGFEKRAVIIDRQIDVFLDGVKIGEAIYRMRLNERRVGPRTYRQWHTPSWGYAHAEPGTPYVGPEFESGSLTHCIEAVVASNARRASA